MKKRDAKPEAKDQAERKPYLVRLPGFIPDKDVGLGDVIKRATAAFGVRACGGCARRAATFNSWITFTGPRSR